MFKKICLWELLDDQMDVRGGGVGVAIGREITPTKLRKQKAIFSLCGNAV